MDTFQTYNMLAAIPEFLVWFGGGLICLYWSSRKPATAVLIGLAMLLAGGRRAAILFAPEISLYLEAFPFSAEQRMLTLYLLFAIPNAVAWGAILTAVARELKQQKAGPPDSL
jgi:hypothetical protein